MKTLALSCLTRSINYFEKNTNENKNSNNNNILNNYSKNNNYNNNKHKNKNDIENLILELPGHQVQDVITVQRGEV